MQFSTLSLFVTGVIAADPFYLTAVGTDGTTWSVQTLHSLTIPQLLVSGGDAYADKYNIDDDSKRLYQDGQGPSFESNILGGPVILVPSTVDGDTLDIVKGSDGASYLVKSGGKASDIQQWGAVNELGTGINWFGADSANATASLRVDASAPQ